MTSPFDEQISQDHRESLIGTTGSRDLVGIQVEDRSRSLVPSCGNVECLFSVHLPLPFSGDSTRVLGLLVQLCLALVIVVISDWLLDLLRLVV